MKANRMTLDKYRETVTPLIKDFKKFLKKNRKFLENENFYGLYQLNYSQWFQKETERLKRNNHDILLRDDSYLNDTWQERGHVLEDVPESVMIQYNSFIEKFSEYLTEEDMRKFDLSSEQNTNKKIIRRSIDSDFYLDNLKDGNIKMTEIEDTFSSVGIRVPKKLKTLKVVDKYERDLTDIVIKNSKEFEKSLREYLEPFTDKLKDRFLSYINQFVEGYESSEFNNLYDYVNNLKGASYSDKSRIKSLLSPFYNHVNNASIRKDNFDNIMNNKSEEYVENVIMNFVGRITSKLLVANTKLGVPKIYIDSIHYYSDIEGNFRVVYDNGLELDLETTVILAGGYNIQRLHERYLMKLSKDGKKVSLEQLDKID